MALQNALAGIPNFNALTWVKKGPCVKLIAELQFTDFFSGTKRGKEVKLNALNTVSAQGLFYRPPPLLFPAAEDQTKAR